MQMNKLVPISALLLAACQPQSDAEVVTMQLAASKAPCYGVGLRACLQQRQPDDTQTLFYAPIAGFDYQWGYEYELLVRVEEAEEVPADASSLTYTLEEVVEQQPVADGTVFDFSGKPVVINQLDGNYQLFGEPFACDDRQLCERMVMGPQQPASLSFRYQAEQGLVLNAYQL